MDLLNLLFPNQARCYCCREPRLDIMGDNLCLRCHTALDKLGSREILFSAEGVGHVYAPFPYTGEVRELVHCLKYTCVRDVAVLLGARMAACLPPDVRYDGLVPVPLHKKRLRERGFNQAALLCEEISKARGIPILPALARVRNTPHQTKLHKSRRLENVWEAFRPLSNVSGLRLLLVDDVCTTGSTATACALALKTAGAECVGLCVAAVTLKDGKNVQGTLSPETPA